MKFNFRIQDYQTDAVNSVVDCFQGQRHANGVNYRRDLGNLKDMNPFVQTTMQA